MRQFQFLWASIVLVMIGSQVRASQDLEIQLQSILDEFIIEHEHVPGVMVHVSADTLDLDWRGAAGVSDSQTKEPITPSQPVRLASITKTYVAAAVLRLAEEEKLEIDDSIIKYLSDRQLFLLNQGGYQPEDISIRHLLTHTSGIWDFVKSNSFVETIQRNPDHVWTRNSQLQLAMEKGRPQGIPGEVYHYSDTGYILLGEIIEHVSGKRLGPALREFLQFDELRLNTTWLELFEETPATAPPRAAQYIGDVPINGWHPSMDLFGGGGLVANMEDVSTFFEALFEGKIFKDEGTLPLMLTTIIPLLGGPSQDAGNYGSFQYCLGLSAFAYRNYTTFGHSGYWGTRAGYVPALDMAFSVAVTQQTASKEQSRLVDRLMDVVIDAHERVN